MQMVILAGGLGTRLRDVVRGPKCLVSVHGRPLLAHLLDFARRAGADDILIAAGYQAAAIRDFLATDPAWAYGVDMMVEPEPLGTAGALRHALPRLDATFGVLNGDTLLVGDFGSLWKFHLTRAALATLAVVEGGGADYGAVAVEGMPGRVQAFSEKSEAGGYISAGLAVMARPVIAALPPGRHSLEREVLPDLAAQGGLYAFPFTRMYDIGTPARLRRADEKWEGPESPPQ